jgi:hypothetical protein
MSKVKILGAALGAALSMSALSAAGTSALPAYFHCIQLVGEKTGKYSTQSECELLKETGATLEWEFKAVGAGEKFSQPTAGGAATLETVKKEKLQCTASKSVSETSGPQTNAKVVVSFESCSGPLSSECQSGATKGLIQTEPLKGRIDYLKKAAPIEVGVLLEPESGTLQAAFKCVGILGAEATVKVRGSLICKVTPVNIMTTTSARGKIECLQSVGKQAIGKFEGEEATHTLETEAKGLFSFEWEQSGEANTQTVTPIHEELKA